MFPEVFIGLPDAREQAGKLTALRRMGLNVSEVLMLGAGSMVTDGYALHTKLGTQVCFTWTMGVGFGSLGAPNHKPCPEDLK